MTHGTQVVDFGRANIGDNGDEVSGIAKITVMEEKLGPLLVPVFVDVVNTPSVESRCTTNDSMNLTRNITKWMFSM
jgi:hypothetical protein